VTGCRRQAAFFIRGQTVVAPVNGLAWVRSQGIAIDAGRCVNYHNRNLVIHLGPAMKSTITSRGQTVVPAEIRRRFDLTAADGLEWLVEGDSIRVYPVRRDPVAAFRGAGKGGATGRLLAERKAERERE
jgi:AbrB family looped-hinge helix DNA binding protein